MIPILREASERVGGPVALSRAIGMKNHNSFYDWKRVPAERVLAIEEATGLSRHQLRPDLYPLDEAAE